VDELEWRYPMSAGDICCLDNFVYHQGNPISSGERWAFVIFYRCKRIDGTRWGRVLTQFGAETQVRTILVVSAHVQCWLYFFFHIAARTRVRRSRFAGVVVVHHSRAPRVRVCMCLHVWDACARLPRGRQTKSLQLKRRRAHRRRLPQRPARRRTLWMTLRRLVGCSHFCRVCLTCRRRSCKMLPRQRQLWSSCRPRRGSCSPSTHSPRCCLRVCRQQWHRKAAAARPRQRQRQPSLPRMWGHSILLRRLSQSCSVSRARSLRH
jgi:hypothetical protein